MRFRIELIVPGSRRTITQIAEDAQFLAFTHQWRRPSPGSTRQAAEALLAALPTGNVADELAKAQLQRALDRIPALRDHLAALGETIAARRGRRRTAPSGGAPDSASAGLTARLLPPPDVLGIYVYLPDRSAP